MLVSFLLLRLIENKDWKQSSSGQWEKIDLTPLAVVLSSLTCRLEHVR